MKTDIQIAQEAQMTHIKDVAKAVGIGEEELEFYGKYKAKLSDDGDQPDPCRGRKDHHHGGTGAGPGKA